MLLLLVKLWGAFQGKTEVIELSDRKIEYSKQKANIEDAEILGKFWNEKGHFIVVYNELTKAPEIFQIDYSEWQYTRIGEKY